MAIRPDNHITGDIAIRQINAKLIPEEWTINIPDSDYGLDMFVEIVINNKTTGKFFFIQSKGTLDSYNNGQISYSLDIAKIKDYSCIGLPVLFVYYSKSEDKFWGRWMNSIYKTLSQTQKKQKSITLHFSHENEIDMDYLRSIGNEIDIAITNKFGIFSKKTPINFKRFHNQIINIAQQYIGKDITNDCRLTCKNLLISYEGKVEDGQIIIHYNEEEIVLPTDIKLHDILYYPTVNIDECPNCILSLIYVIALFGSFISSQSIDYVLSHPNQEIMEVIPIKFWEYFIFNLSSERICAITKLFNTAVLCQKHEISQIIILSICIHNRNKNDSFLEVYHNLLSNYLSSTTNDNLKGVLSYNLANSVRNINLYESFALYMMAVKHEPKYKKRYYWWQEIAGILYLYKHYKYAELFYKRARNLSPQQCSDIINILIADCLICQGKIDEALIEEHSYIKCHKKVSSIIFLKNNISTLMSLNKVNSFNSTYWYNEGIKLSINNSPIEAAKCFLYAWRLCDNDIEALSYALLQSISCNISKNIPAMIIGALREMGPDDALRYIISAILSNNSLKDKADILINNIKIMLYENI